MSGTIDNAKGKIKEEVGDLTDNKSLEREGKGDQFVGNVKDKVDDLRDWAKDKVDDVKNRND